MGYAKRVVGGLQLRIDTQDRRLMGLPPSVMTFMAEETWVPLNRLANNLGVSTKVWGVGALGRSGTVLSQ